MSTERLGTYSIDAVCMSRRRVGAGNAGYGHISSFSYGAPSIFFAILLPDRGAHKDKLSLPSVSKKYGTSWRIHLHPC